MPERIQLKRTKGWRKPENTVVVTRITKWGNPYKEGTRLGNLSIGVIVAADWIEKAKADPDYLLTREDVVTLYQIYVKGYIENNPDYFDIEKLRGKNLACFCKLDEPCHADVLLELANGDNQNG